MLWSEHYDSAAEMMNAMDLVVVADAESSHEGRFVDDAAGGVQFYETTFVVHQTLSGAVAAGDRFVVEHMIAESGSWFALGHHAFEPYDAGTRHLLMLRKPQDYAFYILANAQGRFWVDGDNRVIAPDPDLRVANELDGRNLRDAGDYLRARRID